MKIRASLIKLTIFAVITSFATMILYYTIGNIRPGQDYTTYKAAFTDVTGLLPGDDVRVAGVQVGRITSAKVVEQHAVVTFALESDVRITTAATARVRYKNLLGQRYVALTLSSEGNELAQGATIPLGQTQPALDLTVLFNGFKPLFKALSPADVNKLATEIVATLQGEGGTVDALLASTSSLTNTLASRDAAIGRVITNLSAVMATVADRDETLGGARSPSCNASPPAWPAAPATRSAGRCGASTSSRSRPRELLQDARPALDKDLAHLNTVLATVDAKKGVVDQALKRLPDALTALTRGQSYGSWLNLYVCTLEVTVGDTTVLERDDPEPGC